MPRREVILVKAGMEMGREGREGASAVREGASAPGFPAGDKLALTHPRIEPSSGMTQRSEGASRGGASGKKTFGPGPIQTHTPLPPIQKRSASGLWQSALALCRVPFRKITKVSCVAHHSFALEGTHTSRIVQYRHPYAATTSIRCTQEDRESRTAA